MTTRGKSNTGEGSGARGVCEPPQLSQRWVQGLTVPASCFTVRLDVHQEPGGEHWCYSMEVSDPHSRELMARIVQPARHYSSVLPLASVVSTDMRAVLLELTDPDPF